MGETERRKGQPAPPLAGIDPTQVTTAAEFATLLGVLKARADISYGEIRRRTRDAPNVDRISNDTISAMLNGRRFPSREHLLIFLAAFDLPDYEIKKWNEAWGDLVSAGAGRDSSALGIARRQNERLTQRLEEVERNTDELARREQQLRQDLAAATEKCHRLQTTIAQLRRGVAAEQARAEQLQHELTATQKRVDDLQAELRFIHEERRRVEAERDYLLAQQADLESTRDSLQLQYDRAEYERRQREAAERVKRTLEQRITVLEQRLTTEQPPREPAPASVNKVSTTKQPLKFVNHDIELEIALSDSDFDIGQHDVSVPYDWYCVGCDKGGEQPYATCPYCAEVITRDYSRTVLFNLPLEPCYGKRLRLAGQGNHDEPSMKPSDLYVRVERRPSRWEQWRQK